jgi:hypothetical protein
VKYVIQGKNGLKSVNLNRRKAIRERCLNCSGWSTKEVTKCEFSDCQLYPFGTGSGRQDPKARNNSIHKYCLWCMNGQRAEVSNCPSFDCSLYPYRKTRVHVPQNVYLLPEKGHIEGSSEQINEIEYIGMAN